ncbi:hypothetical protein FRC03_012101 [Tulasnella sp. 419]|nr:hypothetical protein FRC03_012101 [Tulasnella sp. 419]
MPTSQFKRLLSDTRVQGIQIADTRHAITKSAPDAVASQNGLVTPPRAPRRKGKNKKIKRESTELSDQPTELNTTASPPPARPVRPFPHRCSQSPILQTINRREKVKNSSHERRSLDHAKLEDNKDSDPRHHSPGPGPSTTPRPSMLQRPRQTGQLVPFSRRPIVTDQSSRSGAPLMSPSVAGRPPLPSTSDAFFLPAVFRREPRTSNLSGPKNLESQNIRTASPPVTSQPEHVPSQAVTHHEVPSEPFTRRRGKRKADDMDGEATQPTRFSRRLIVIEEKKKEKERKLELAKKMAERATRRRINVKVKKN